MDFKPGVTYIKDSILEVGYLMSRRELAEKVQYQIRFLGKDNLQDIIRLQQIVLNDLKDSEIYQPVSEDKLTEYLGKNYVIGVETDVGLIGVSCFNIPEENYQNLGQKIGLSSEEDLKKVAHIQLSFIHPEYRGNSLQSKLIKHIIRIISTLGYSYILCMVSHKNIYSLRNMLQNGLLIKGITSCNGLLRYILCRDINAGNDLISQNVITIKIIDIEGQINLLNDGYSGFDLSINKDNIMIYYGKG